jgi:predicted acylesterase/phospholipase RssA
MSMVGVSCVSDPDATHASGGTQSWDERSAADRLAAAQAILRGQGATLDALQELASALKNHDKRFTPARRLLLRARRHEAFTAQPQRRRHKILQQLALCTYKDDDLPAERRFARALEWLKEIAELNELADQESLCLAGAIFKRQWESTGQVAHLKRALAFYHRGHAAAAPGTAAYDGYAAINAAYVSDVLALEETKNDPNSLMDREYRTAAEKLRREIVAELPNRVPSLDDESKWWLLVTIAEAHFGLLNFVEATEALTHALSVKAYAWQKESTARQIASLAHLIAVREPARAADAYAAIEKAFRLTTHAREGLCLGRIGLALSGGGFRASLFHIGVLARLAELDLLRHVEVLSCVSGGSIIGAYYYLELRSRMLEKADTEISVDDYIAIVQRIEEKFLEGVQTNLRSSLLTNVWASLRMIIDPGYSRTTRIGNLYQSRLFDRVPLATASGQKAQPQWISELPFQPKGAHDFNPKSHNWERGAKVPMLVLNATTLNTGHNWQFTGTWMGEAATTIDNRIDSNDYLRRMYYSEAPRKYKCRGVPLGHAVAASSCVPGLFPALKLSQLYKDHPVVRLVDGGVHDNQGMAALIDQDCNVILVSDASGQLRSEANPPGGVLGGPTRSNSVLQARVRLAQYRELDSRQRSGALRGLMWVHLREELEPTAVEWNDSLDPFSREDEGLPDRDVKPLLTYGVHRDLQDALARLRTDLDSFSDIEAHALMCSAYLMTTSALAREDSPFPNRTSRTAKWRFLDIASHLRSPESFRAPVARALQVGEQLPLKVWRLSPWLSALATAVLFAMGLGVLYVVALLAWRFGLLDAVASGVKSPLRVTALFALSAVVTVVSRWALRTYGGVGEMFERSTMGVLAVLLWIPMWIHRTVFDPIFLRRGRYTKT